MMNHSALTSMLEIDRRYHLHPKANPAEIDRLGGLLIRRAQGIRIEDDQGRVFIDATAGLANVNIGYGDHRVLAAIKTQLDSLCYAHTFGRFTNEPAAELAGLLGRIMPDYERFYFVSSGSEAIETSVKLAHYYWILNGKPNKRFIISRDLAYHGNTLFATALTGIPGYHEQCHAPLDWISRVEAPCWYRNGRDLTPDDYGREAAARFGAKLQEIGPENVAALIVEPMQASGGGIFPPESYLPEIMRICRENDVLIIGDEVITGFGRLGHWLGQDAYGLKADIVAMAKGISSGYLPMGAVGISPAITEALVASDSFFAHGFSSSGHPTACAASIANINVIEADGLLQNARIGTGAYLQRQLKSLVELPQVGEVRGVGMAAAIELDMDRILGVDDPGKAVVDACLEKGLIVRGGHSVVVLSPPLILTDEDADYIVATLRTAIASLLPV